ncbi:alpha-hydroxy-acid oxidizing protein [Acidaminobacter hydrogenoformans]|uniref:L-lactate oxidase n=1 Tax=Acidaminobacter hydrogenoformans DSM 2784 TaxID=1120920 RepID=A0A1G5S384_9FIRM|nr:alpha-hydroxy-acid oxidizing protein [Acidaminobacter hydrogenoformans]SCZ80835.1 FMN-dependent dehydrogenase, includes L-lactate dehydrogenase and type II isopentenyl diphosphate isomerase [Acidaminobacter hydrogenoformans DSM 2784]
MNYQEVLNNAKQNIGPYCKVCPECNGIACRGMIPGPGGKGSGLGFIRSYQDLKKVRLQMDTIYEPKAVSTETTLFGKKVALPVFAAPIGAVGLHYSDAYDDLSYSSALLSGCHKAGTAAFTGDGVKDEVFQGTIEAIYELEGWGIPTIKPWSYEEVLNKAKMAEASGAFAVAMDIDAAGLSILAAQGKPVAPMSVETLSKIIAQIKVPFVLKGIMTAEGARKALEAGASGIVVSNHGGRVLDETPSTIEVLPEIVEAVGGKMTILIDGGVRTGLDVFKAIALGAQGVLIGRPFAYAIYGGAEEGVQLYLNKVKAELSEAMLMTGAGTIEEITREKVCAKLER